MTERELTQNEAGYWKLLIKELKFGVGGRTLDWDLFDMWMDVIGRAELKALTAAFRLHRSESEYSPSPAKILDKLMIMAGYLSPEEAWNLAPKTEVEGAYVCDEMQAALSACEFSLQSNDRVAARMAFIERYKTEILRAKITMKTARYFYSEPSVGSHQEKLMAKEHAAVSAHSKKLISNERLNKVKQLTSQQDFSLKRLAANPELQKEKNKEAREKLAAIREQLT